MKVVYLHQHFRTPRAAGGTRPYEMGRRIAARGHDVHIICGGERQAPGAITTERCDGMTVHKIAVAYSNRMSPLRRLLAFAHYAVVAAYAAWRLQADVVLASSTPLTVILPARAACFMRRTPLIFEVRDLWPEVPIAMGVLRDPVTKYAARWLERLAYRSSAAVVALSPGMADGIANVGVERERLHVIPNASDIGLFDVDDDAGRRFRAAHPEIGDRPIVLYSGTMGKVYGVDYMVRIAHCAAQVDDSVCFLAVGDGGERPRVRALAEEKGVLGRNFFLIDPVPKVDVPALHSAAAVCLSLVIPLPELWNNSANKFFDALAASRPIAINHDGWQADLIRAEGIGVVLPADDASRAADCLLAFLRDRDRLEEAGRRAGLVARTQFDRDMLAARLVSVLEHAHAQS